VPSKRVSLADLDLSTRTGACTALRRIKFAAGEVCPDSGERLLDLWRERKQCMEESIARAVKDTHSAQIQAVYTKRSGGC
jgi:UrcA family protein